MSIMTSEEGSLSTNAAHIASGETNDPTTTHEDVEHQCQCRSHMSDVEESVAIDIAGGVLGTVFKGNRISITSPAWWLLPVLVFSQFAGTSLWFAGNAVLADLSNTTNNNDNTSNNNQSILNETSVGYITSAVQAGFIIGTLTFSASQLADRMLPTRIFLICSILGATSNAAIILAVELFSSSQQVFIALMICRAITGFFLAGIYPIGMKVAADWYAPRALGQALGWLVGALVVGTALPFLLTRFPAQHWRALVAETSALAIAGGVVLGCFVPNGPYRHQRTAAKFDSAKVVKLFWKENPPYRAACCAYFGHMWEIYAFWALLPVVWQSYLDGGDANGFTTSHPRLNTDVVTFCVIAAGAVGCVVGGSFSERFGSAWVAALALLGSGIACLISPWLYTLPVGVTLPLYLLWGVAAAADSPQLSSLVAQTAPPEIRGSALTFSTCVGFAISIGSIQLLQDAPGDLSNQYLFFLLAPGPLLGLICLRPLLYPSSKLKNKDEDRVRQSSSRTVNPEGLTDLTLDS